VVVSFTGGGGDGGTTITIGLDGGKVGSGVGSVITGADSASTAPTMNAKGPPAATNLAVRIQSDLCNPIDQMIHVGANHPRHGLKLTCTWS
jgi:hypothetical protein